MTSMSAVMDIYLIEPFISLVPLFHDEVSLIPDLPVIQHAQVSVIFGVLHMELASSDPTYTGECDLRCVAHGTSLE